MARRNPIPPRVAARPNPALWQDDELMNVQEAAALFWPDGPLSATSLRNAIHKGQLPVLVIARKHLLTKAAIRLMVSAFVSPSGSGAQSSKD